MQQPSLISTTTFSGRYVDEEKYDHYYMGRSNAVLLILEKMFTIVYDINRRTGSVNKKYAIAVD